MWQPRGEDMSSSGKLTGGFFMSVTEQQTLAIEALVRRRCDELGLTQPELIRRCGYQNVSKGLRRLEQLYSGDFKKSAGLIDKLPTALEVPVDVIKHAVEDSQRYLRESEEAAWRAAFRPHAIILTERQIPQPIFVAALIGVEALLRARFRSQFRPRHLPRSSPRWTSSETREMAR